MTYDTFPFGKYKGFLLRDIPTTYLAYAIETFDLPDELMDGLRSEMVDRLELGNYKSDFNKVQSIYRQLSKRYHPDAGGTKEAMQAINDFRSALL
jgi:hypothetical protein